MYRHHLSDICFSSISHKRLFLIYFVHPFIAMNYDFLVVGTFPIPSNVLVEKGGEIHCWSIDEVV